MWDPAESDVLAFLATQELCVVSTLGPAGQPQAATVAFSAHAGLKLVFGTSQTSHKYANLRRDGRVAVVVTDPDERLTMQYEGRARVLTMAEFEPYEDAHYRKLPGSLPFKHLPDEANILIEPVLVRFSNVAVHPWAVKVYRF